MGRRVGSQSDFWRPPLWKWLLFLLLLACGAVLLFRKQRSPTATLPLLKQSAPAWDGSYSFVVISPTAQSPSPKFKVSISSQKPSVRHDSPVNEFQVDLHSGMFALRQTDLFIPDVMPLSLTRTYRVWDERSRAFGIGANHPYDICPTGTRFPYTYLDLNLEDGRQIHFPRISTGTGYADAVYRHEETSSEFYGAQFSWNGDGWTLDFADRRVFLFPEAYAAKNCAQGATTEMRDEKGNRIQLKRDKVRNLEELVSPSGHAIAFKYDGSDRIIEADDDAGHIRKYSYYSHGHLETVSDGERVLYRFEYVRLPQPAGYDPYFMTSITDGHGTELIRNWYADGSRVSKQRLADGQVFGYNYLFDGRFQVVETVVTLPSGQERRFFFRDGMPSNEK
jgi:YD repeat-containing protein